GRPRVSERRGVWPVCIPLSLPRPSTTRRGGLRGNADRAAPATAAGPERPRRAGAASISVAGLDVRELLASRGLVPAGFPQGQIQALAVAQSRHSRVARLSVLDSHRILPRRSSSAAGTSAVAATF